jgi:cysteine synthase A
MSDNDVKKIWLAKAMNIINADFNRSSDTHLIKVDLPCFSGVSLYLKDESTHPTGSLKHRLARSLFLYGLCNGLIKQNSPIIESSSGSTAISEAYFARLLGLRFIAVVPKSTAVEKIKQIEFYGGECFKVEPSEIYAKAQQLADELNGHYMDQFTYNIAESIFAQMQMEPQSIPSWIVVSAGTGGTSATIGRYLRYNPALHLTTRLAVVDPDNSVFFDYFQQRDCKLTSNKGSRIEGIGRPRVEPSFLPDVVDHMIQVPDAASIATMRWLEGILGRKCGGSTGTNVYGALTLIAQMVENKQQGSVVSMICDSGERYLNSYYNDDWVAQQQLDLAPYTQQLEVFMQTGRMTFK